MTFPDLAEYRRLRSTKSNLLVHLVAVPIFVFSIVSLFFALLEGAIPAVIAWAVAALISMMLQRHGHKRESESPRSFCGPTDFLRRWFGEQFIIFPWFVLSGNWLRQWRSAPPL